MVSAPLFVVVVLVSLDRVVVVVRNGSTVEEWLLWLVLRDEERDEQALVLLLRLLLVLPLRLELVLPLRLVLLDRLLLWLWPLLWLLESVPNLPRHLEMERQKPMG